VVRAQAEVINGHQSTRFSRGDIVEVRPPGEILASLDPSGELDGLPFMPEMLQFCGRRFTVAARADKICDTVTPYVHGSRRMADTVLLEGLRCDGSGHGGCQADCLLYWKEAWLRPSARGARAVADADDGSLAAIHEQLSKRCAEANGDEITYRCQATRAVDASTPLSNKDPRPYIAACSSGNVRFGTFLRVMGRAASHEVQNKVGRLPNPPLRGRDAASPRLARLDLVPGEWVRVKQPAEIEATLNDKGMNRGLWFDREMLAHCGRTFQVRRRVTQFIDERTGKMIKLTSDCVTLEGSVCSGEWSLSRWFCPRAIYPYWREGWLERVPPSP
jgi:hypothetical protein